MKIGDLFKNNWASYETYLVYISGNSRMSNVLGCTFYEGKWKLSKKQFYTNDLGSENVPKIGHIDLTDIILKAVGKENEV